MPYRLLVAFAALTTGACGDGGALGGGATTVPGGSPWDDDCTRAQRTLDGDGGLLLFVGCEGAFVAALELPAGALDGPETFTLAAAADLDVAGFVPVGPAIAVTPADAALAAPARVIVPFDAARLPAGAAPSDVVVLLPGGQLAAERGDGVPTGSVRVTTDVLGTFQAAAPGAPPSQPPGPPTLVSAAPGEGAVTVSWASPGGASRFDLYLATEPGVAPATVAGLAGGLHRADVTSPHTETGLAAGVPVYVVITASNAVGEGLPSAEVSATPLASAPPPAGPPLLIAASVGGAARFGQAAAVNFDGSLVAFESHADDLVAGDSNGLHDIFVRDATAGVTSLIPGPPGTGAGNGSAQHADLSANGRYVVFDTSSDNWAGSGLDTNWGSDVYWHDRQSGVTELVSARAAGDRPGDERSRAATVSDDGRFVAFASMAGDLTSPPLTTGLWRVLLRDRTTGDLTHVTAAPGGGDVSPGTVGSVRLAADASAVVFTSTQTHLVVPAPPPGLAQVYRFERASGAVTLLSVGPAGAAADADCEAVDVSADGRLVAFASAATTLTAGAPGAAAQVYLLDASTGAVERISVAADGAPADAACADPTLSADGRFVAFTSDASNLGPGPALTAPGRRVYVRDRAANTTALVSVLPDGARFDGWARAPHLSGDGRFVVLQSNAPALSIPSGTGDSLLRFANPLAAP